MSGVERLADADSGSPVSNGCDSPQSPECSTILDTPLTLDFDPMSFQFQELANAATSPTSDEDSRAEDRNSEPIIIKSANYTNPSLNVFDPLVTSDLDLAPPPQPSAQMNNQSDVTEQSFVDVKVNGVLEVAETVELVPGPDILDNPAISNPNPDLVLIDNVTVVPAAAANAPGSSGSEDSRPPSEKSVDGDDSTTSSSEMIDLLGSSSTNEHVDSSVVNQCVDVVTVTSYAASSVESTCLIKEASRVQQHSDDQESDVVDGDVLSRNKHDVFEETLMHEETLSSDSESDSRAKLVAKKNLTTTAQKKISSTSSESSVSEHGSKEKFQSKEIIMKKSNVSSRVEEKTINITSTKTSSDNTNIVSTTRNNKPLNGVENKIDLNGTHHRKHDSESSSSSDEECETPKIECPISVTKLDDSHYPSEPNDSEDLQSSEKEVVLAVDLRSLGIINKPPIVERKQAVTIAAKKQLSNFKSVQRNQYVMHAEQEIPVSPTKEIAVTGVDLQSLKSSYSKSNSINEDDISKDSKEIISTGVDIKQLKHSFANGSIPSVSEENIYKEAETIETSISVRSLKTSFSKSNEEVENYISAPVEEVKPSVDRAQVTRKFSQEVESLNASVDEHGARGNEDDKCLCKICDKHVYQMEKVKAEKSIFHKNCFRCKECAKQLTVDAYNSHEGQIYCKQHFKQIFEPKPRFEGEDIAPTENLDHDDLDTEEGKQRRNEMIIRENTPVELPPDVVRSCEDDADTKSNDLESLPNLNLSNIKSRFESQQDEPKLPSVSDLCTLSRSPSIMARLAKYQSALSKEGQTNGDLSGDEEPEHEHDPDIVRETRQHREKVNFAGLSSLKDQWESGNVNATAEEAKEDVKDDLAKLRQRICLGRSESMKAVYEKACQDTKTKSPVRSESVVLGRDVKALSIKDKFEKGAIENDEEIEAEKYERLRKEKEEDLSVFTEPGTAIGARSMFRQMDASVKSPSPTQLSPSKSPSMVMRTHNDSVSSQASENEIVKGSAPNEREDIQVETTLITEKFKFFENYKEEEKERKRFQITPPREPAKEPSPEPEAARDPNIVRSTDVIDDLPVTDTAKKMLDKFKALESQTTQEHVPMPTTPKPLKRITPPREDGPKVVNVQVDNQPQVDPDIVRCSYKSDDDIVVEADKAKSLRAKFENWELEVSRENLKNEKLGMGIVDVSGNGVEETDFLPQVDTTKNLKAKFEAIKDETAKTSEKPKPKARRFIQEQQSAFGETCNICEKRLYPLEKMEDSGMKFHKNCFRCAHCNCVLRLDNFTTSAGKLFCTPHFKQLFISKGNYDEGFGREKISEKWNRSRSSTPTPRENGDTNYTNGHVEEMV